MFQSGEQNLGLQSALNWLEIGVRKHEQDIEFEVTEEQEDAFCLREYIKYIYRFIHKSLRDFRTRLRNNQDRHGRKERINR